MTAISKNKVTTRQAFRRLDTFIKLAKPRARKNPLLVTLLMHEYFRNLYPVDPFIPKRIPGDHLKNIMVCLDNCIEILLKADSLGTYFSSRRPLSAAFSVPQVRQTADGPTQKVYGRLWKKLSAQYLCAESEAVLKRLFSQGGLGCSYIRGKKILDMGCGSGRFTLAFAKLGAKSVTGVDLGEEGLVVGKKMARELKLRNIRFIKHSVLDLPFRDSAFDFIFCKGVLHHTGNLRQGLKELWRVLKDEGRAFLYLYANGGLFWYSRRRMREVMRHIPIDYVINVLDLIGMPAKRYIFVDSWYVPIEEHTYARELEPCLRKLGFKDIQRIKCGSPIELESVVFSNTPYAKELWGDGELRYFLQK